jgi:hypothetical protein
MMWCDYQAGLLSTCDMKGRSQCSSRGFPGDRMNCGTRCDIVEWTTLGESNDLMKSYGET